MSLPTKELAIIADENDKVRDTLKSQLITLGFEPLEATNGQEAVDLFSQHNNVSIVFMGLLMPLVDGYDAAQKIKQLADTRFVPIIFLTYGDNQPLLTKCIKAGGDDFLIIPYTDFVLEAKLVGMRRISTLTQKIQGMYSLIHREQEIAETVFINAVQGMNIKNPHLKNDIRPASTFSGDMVLSAYSPSHDLLFLIGDFTGHGLSAALGALPVSEVFRAMATKGFEPGEILIAINKKLKSLLPLGMFFGVQLVVISYDLEHSRIYNAGMPDLLIIDGNTNQIRHKVDSRGLPLGIIDHINPQEFVQFFPIFPNDKILMYSDGLIEARDSNDIEYGEDRLEKVITASPKNEIFEQIFIHLDKFCDGTPQVDDVTLVEISCVPEVLKDNEKPTNEKPAISTAQAREGEWSLSLRFSGKSLRETNPVPIIVNHIMEMEHLETARQSLFTVVTELYVNALDHGVLGLQSSLKSDPAGFVEYFSQRESKLAEIDSGYINLDLAIELSQGSRNIVLTIEDSGDGYDYENYRPPEADSQLLSGRGTVLIRSLCESLDYQGKGNIARAIFCLK